MAEQLDLSINIGANTQDFQGALQKAQNLLSQFQSALKKATNVGEINYLNTQIKNLEGTIAGINAQMNKVGRPAGDATNALMNLSRVAQDAPYGFMGIANNLNPLLESFQRLQKESGSGANALKSLVSGLMGPAGLGLALGVVSSVVVKFGDDIQKFISEKAVGLGKAFTKESEIVSSGINAFVKARLEIVDLNNEFSNYTNGIITKDAFLKKFNDTLGDTVKETKDLATAEKFLTQYADDYVQMTFKKAIANEAAAQAAKKQVEAEITRAKPSAAFKGVGDFTTLFFGGNVASIDKVAKARQNTIATNAENDVTLLESIRVKYQKEATAIQAELSKIFGPPEIKNNDKTKFDKAVQEYKKELDKQFNKIKEGFGTKKPEQIIDAFVSPKIKPKEYLSGANPLEDLFAANATQFNKAAKDAEDFNKKYTEIINSIGQNMAVNLGNALGELLAGGGIRNALQSFLTILADGLISVGKLAIETGLAIGAIKQALKTLNPVVAVAAGVSLIALGSYVKSQLSNQGNAMGGTPRMAEGGIVSKPTYALIGEGNESEAVMPLSKLGSMMRNTFDAGAMSGGGGANGGNFVLRGNDLVLALQRSNYSLNLRRGA
jgi:hypothetical protein